MGTLVLGRPRAVVTDEGLHFFQRLAKMPGAKALSKEFAKGLMRPCDDADSKSDEEGAERPPHWAIASLN